MFLCRMVIFSARRIIWAAPWENQHSVFATSMDPDQPGHPRSLVRIHAVHFQSLLQWEKVLANRMDPEQTVLMRRLVWIHAGRKATMLIFPCEGADKIDSFISSNYKEQIYWSILYRFYLEILFMFKCCQDILLSIRTLFLHLHIFNNCALIYILYSLNRSEFC